MGLFLLFRKKGKVFPCARDAVHGPKSSRGGVVRKKRVFYVVMVHPFLAIQAFLPPVLRTAAEIYFRAAGGRASFLLVPATRQTPIARIYSLAFCCARLRRSCSSHAAVHGHGHARIINEAYDVRQPCVTYDDGVCSRAILPMSPFASTDCICRHRVASCADPPWAPRCSNRI